MTENGGFMLSHESDAPLTRELLRGLLVEYLDKYISDKGYAPGKVLIIPPDCTRLYSGGGLITQLLVALLHERGCACVDVLPALGTHVPVSRDEWKSFFGDCLPYESVLVHNWRNGVVRVGTVPADFVRDVSEGLVDTDIPVEVARPLVEGGYDLILSVGQVVPHEVVGMANYTKNILVGCGGSGMINASHMLGAFYGMERIMGRDFSPVRKVFDYAEENFLAAIPITYVLTVASSDSDGNTALHGVYIGRSRSLFEKAVSLSRKINLTHLPKPLKKAVVYLDPAEFRSTWLGNKAIYRTRMAMADGGKLIILAPGVDKFGEDAENDRLIRKYGYVGRKRVLELVAENDDLKNNLSVAAHLIHGSSDGRFSVTYCTSELSESEITGVSFGYAPYSEAAAEYDITHLRDGFNTVNGEEIFYISNPALGLWTFE